MPRKLKLPTEDGKTEELDVVLKEDMDSIVKQFSAGLDKLLSEIKTAKTLPALAQTGAALTQARSEEKLDYCPECEVYTKNLYQHIKKDPEKHGLMSKVEEEKPPVKRHKTAAEHLDCPDCYPQFEGELLRRGWKKPEPQPPTEKKGGFPV